MGNQIHHKTKGTQFDARRCHKPCDFLYLKWSKFWLISYRLSDRPWLESAGLNFDLIDTNDNWLKKKEEFVIFLDIVQLFLRHFSNKNILVRKMPYGSSDNVWTKPTKYRLIDADLHCPSMLANFGKCSLINPTFIGFEETSSYWSIQFFSVFHWSH